MTPSRARQGRPPRTSRQALAHVALHLFAERGFEETTLDDVAAAVGVSRRTVFRYYPSKNDIVWGEFTEHVAGLREHLAAADTGEPMMEVLRRAVVTFNDYGDAEMPELRIRMALITTVPALQGHSMRRYQEWCEAVAGFAARRLGLEPDDHVPQVIANAALGTAMATYRHWILHDDTHLLAELDRAFRLLAAGFDEAAIAAPPRPV